MKRKLMAIAYFLQWILYFLLTMDVRTNYMIGQQKGMHVEKSEDKSWLLPGSTTEYTFNPNRKPERDYITWNEFWKARGYKNG